VPKSSTSFSLQRSAVVLYFGTDSPADDKLGCFNVATQGNTPCNQFLNKQNIPLILLGGGGYTVKNVVHTWAYEMVCALGVENEIDPHLPWDEYFEWFAPRYLSEVLGNDMYDLDTKNSPLD
jgi:histone deacetylase 1/2